MPYLSGTVQGRQIEGVAMIRSMTGFGHSTATAHGFKIEIDMKSVNHRYLEISVRLPREWLAFEEPMKKRIQQQIKRGRVDVFVTIGKEPGTAPAFTVNWAAADAYMNIARELAGRYSLEELPRVSDILGLPEVISAADEGGQREQLADTLMACVDEALGNLMVMRETEGAALKADMLNRLAAVEALRNAMNEAYPEAVTQAEHQLRQRIMALLKDHAAFDEQRFAMETALMADRMSIDEELTRLGSHVRQLKETLEQSEPVGRKLDFLIQEMNRETNTIGSKANNSAISRLVVEMKAELEKMREQIQNIE